MTIDDLRRNHPSLFLLNGDDADGLSERLTEIGVLEIGESVTAVAPAGDGNMNLTVRARTDRRTLIVKQSRPWVERYPQIAAPWDRVLGEAEFYRLAAPHRAIASRMPRLHAVDRESRMLVLEDLGEGGDYTSLYAGVGLSPADARQLAEWLSALHAEPHPESSQNALADTAMRRLNHEHVFRFPLDPRNGLDLDAITPGLRREADTLAADVRYVRAVARLARTYLEGGPRLAHGDFFPGSWLHTPAGPAIIDPEFAFFGSIEFDLGVMHAHLQLSGQSPDARRAVDEAYRPPAGFDRPLADAFCGVEIMRRLIGVAQLPLDLPLDRKRELLSLSRTLVMGSSA